MAEPLDSQLKAYAKSNGISYDEALAEYNATTDAGRTEIEKAGDVAIAFNEPPPPDPAPIATKEKTQVSEREFNDRIAGEQDRSARIRENERKAVVNGINPEVATEITGADLLPDENVGDLAAEIEGAAGGATALSNFPQQLRNLLSAKDSTATQNITATPAQQVILTDFRYGSIDRATASRRLRAAGASTPEQITALLANESRLAQQMGSGSDVALSYQDVAYKDQLSNTVPAQEPESLVELPNNRVVRYAEGSAPENEGPAFLIDALVWVQGVEISQFIKGEIRVSLSGTQGNNEASFTLDNSNDRFVWTERNLVSLYGENAIAANAPFIDDFKRTLPADPENNAQLLDLMKARAFTQHELIKEEIFAYKANPTRNPRLRNPRGTVVFARYDLVPFRCCFNRMDPIRIFSLYPFRVPGKEYEKDGRLELWMPEFTGYIENISVDDDDIRGVSSITVDCVDIRQAVLRRMRTSYSGITSGLAAPLEQLGFAVGQQATIASGTGTNVVDAARETTDGFFNIDNTQFYDDIVTSQFGQPAPNKPLEGALREVLVANEPITTESTNRGVRGVDFGGNFYYDAENWDRPVVQRFLQDWHKFTLFGPKRRPWTRLEVDTVGRGTTTDGTYAPNKCRLWQLLPRNGSGPKNLADLSTVSYPFSHDINWTNRMEVIENLVQSIDYNFMVSPCGDFITEFHMGDFRPEDFGEFKDSFRVDKGLITTQFGDEQDIPPAGLVVTRGMAAAAQVSDDVALTKWARVFVYSPYIAARYGVEIAQETLPFLQATDKVLAQQRAVLMYQQMLSRSHAFNASFTYRPFILPNRPIHHLRRGRIGCVVSTDKEVTLAQEPKGTVSVGLDRIRLFSGHYRNQQDFKSLNEVQKRDNESKGRKSSPSAQSQGADPTSSEDTIELQVFNTVSSGESSPTSARVPWGAIPGGQEGEISVLAPAAGIYVLDLDKDKPKPKTTAPPAHDDASTPAPAEEPEEEQPPPLFKFPNNPLASMNVVSAFGVERGIGSTPHQGVDLTAANGTPVYAVDDGRIVRASPSRGGGNVVLLETKDGFWVQYLHLDARSYSGDGDFRGVRYGQQVSAGDQIAISNNTGNTSGPHLHIDLIITGKVKPELLDERAATRLGTGKLANRKIDLMPYVPAGNYQGSTS